MLHNRKAPNTASLCLIDQIKCTPVSGTPQGSVSLLITLFTIYLISGKSVGQRLQKQQHTVIVHALQIIYRSHLLNITSCQPVHRKCRFYFFNIKFNMAFEEPFSCFRQTNATDVMVHYFSCFLLLKKIFFTLQTQSSS